MCYALAFCPGNLDTSLGTLACGVNVALVVKAHVPLLKKSLDGRVVDAIVSALVATHIMHPWVERPGCVPLGGCLF